MPRMKDSSPLSKTPTSIKLTPELEDQLTKLATALDRSKQEVIRLALEVGLEDIRQAESLPRLVVLASNGPTVFEFPLYGPIAAGQPRMPMEEWMEKVTVPFSKAPREIISMSKAERSKCFALKVSGKSMIGEGLSDGDIVLLAEREPKIGDIVAAYVDGDGFTLKTLALRNGQHVLLCANPKFKDIVPVHRLEIRHVYVGKLDS